VRRAFPRLRARVRGFRVPSGVPEQPYGLQAARGARRRAERALGAWPAADYGIGVEAGLQRDAGVGRIVDVQHVAVVDPQGSLTAAHGGGFYYPESITRQVRSGATVSEAIGPVAGDARIGSTIGAVGFLSRGALTRRELTEQAVLLALVPRIRRDLYQE
jgi:inosine/xanthosine triphosphatase